MHETHINKQTNTCSRRCICARTHARTHSCSLPPSTCARESTNGAPVLAQMRSGAHAPRYHARRYRARLAPFLGPSQPTHCTQGCWCVCVCACALAYGLRQTHRSRLAAYSSMRLCGSQRLRSCTYAHRVVRACIQGLRRLNAEVEHRRSAWAALPLSLPGEHAAQKRTGGCS